MKSRTRLSTAARRDQLLQTTCEAIAHDGVRGLRVDDVAARAGVSTALLYYHFGSREGLLAATMRHVNDRAERYTAAPPGLAGADRLLHELLGEFQDDDGVRANSAVWGELQASAVFEPSLRELAMAATEDWNRAVAESIAHGQADATIDPAIDPPATAERLTALVDGLGNRWLTGQLSTARAHEQIRAALAPIVLTVNG